MQLCKAAKRYLLCFGKSCKIDIYGFKSTYQKTGKPKTGQSKRNKNLKLNMGQFLMKITIRKNHNSNRIELMKGMSIELICGSSSSISTREMDQICDMFSDKYHTKCERGFLKMSDIDIEKLG